jgi:ribosomal-protein-alanine N-acetyltransferase
MRPADLERVLEIENESYAMPWTESTFRGLLRRRDADMLAAESNGRLIGYAAAWSVLDQCELGNVAVEEAWRNHGIGARLVLAVVERACGRGVKEVFLEVRPSNPAAQHLYRKLGFQLVGRRKNYYLEPPEDALVMRLELKPPTSA